MSDTINVLRIVRGTSVDGPGLRTAIYMAGCTHRCPGCHNPSSWDENAGTPMTIDELMHEICNEGNNVTLTGGDPLMHPEAVKQLSLAIHNNNLNIWLYTGYRWEEIAENKILKSALENIDVIVDGPFIQSLHDPDLLFIGSSNQRILSITHTGEAHPWHNPFDIYEL